MIKNIFFDYNGTLIDDLNVCCEIEQEMMVRANLRPYTMEEYIDKFYFPVRSYYHDVGFKDEDYPDLAEYFMTQYENRWRKESSLFSGSKEALLLLKKEGYALYCLSATKQDLLDSALKFLGIYDIFDGVCGASDNYAHGKIEYGKEFAKKHHIKNSETIMIGDTEHDYETAKALGFSCILFTKGHCSKRRLVNLNVPLFDSYEELPKIIDNLNKK